MTFIISILLFCILSSVVQGQNEVEMITEAITERAGKTGDEENQFESTTSMNNEMTEENKMTFEPQTTTVVDCVSSNTDITNCQPCPAITSQMATTCPPCSTTTSCPPCPTTASETAMSCPPCENSPQPMPTCPPCEASVPPTTNPPCTTAEVTTAPPMSPKTICDHLNGTYTETLCRYQCKRYRPYKIIFEDFMVNGEECWLGDKKGTCQPGLLCRIPPPPPSWW